MKNIKRNILLNPGPATTTASVKHAQVVPDICPREQEFGDVIEFVSTKLTQFIADPAQYVTVLFGSSGTAAVESILSSVIDQGILIINNGAYGKRMCEIADAYNLRYIEFQSSLTEPIDLQQLDTWIQQSAFACSHLAVVHHETTTGLLNDIASIGGLCKKYSMDFIVDAMSSYAAIPIHMKDMNISYLAASSNKNLQGMPGISFVIACTEKLKASREIKPKNYYLHLFSQYDYYSLHRQTRFTPPVQTFYALQQAIRELEVETVENRYARYVRSWETLVSGCNEMGLEYLVPEHSHAKLITAIKDPICSGYDFMEMHDFLYSNGYTIYPGKLANHHSFRVANIGDITYMDIENFLKLLAEYLKRIKYIQ
ncbi:2-aminoethylphosphonate aminotransferase [Brevibacillus sp. SIMBA_040]|uniref:2-aminoethylphosphonate aminotransferase n=2 Tax=Bacillales TaxID=1385 RepID=UPI00397AE20A